MGLGDPRQARRIVSHKRGHVFAVVRSVSVSSGSSSPRHPDSWNPKSAAVTRSVQGPKLLSP